MASVCSKTHGCAEKRRRGGPPGSRVMAEAIVLYFSYAEPSYAKIKPDFVSPGPEAFFAHVSRLGTLRPKEERRRNLRFAPEVPETTAEFAAFLDFLAPQSNRSLQALVIAERALAGYVFFLGKDDCEDWPRSHLVQPLTWFLKLLLPDSEKSYEKVLGSELKHVAELIVKIDGIERRPVKIFKALQKIQATQSFEDLSKLIA